MLASLQRFLYLLTEVFNQDVSELQMHRLQYKNKPWPIEGLILKLRVLKIVAY